MPSLIVTKTVPLRGREASVASESEPVAAINFERGKTLILPSDLEWLEKIGVEGLDININDGEERIDFLTRTESGKMRLKDRRKILWSGLKNGKPTMRREFYFLSLVETEQGACLDMSNPKIKFGYEGVIVRFYEMGEIYEMRVMFD